MARKCISIVVACFNEEDVITLTATRLRELAASLERYRFELIFIDDGSTDATLEKLRRIAAQDDRVRVIQFTRNFGHQIAVTAGVDAAIGDAVVLIDADLQDPPEVIPEMIAKWEDGFDVVYGTRMRREGESAFKKQSAKAFYRVMNRMSEIDIPLDTGDFRLMGRNVVEVLKSMPERHRFVRGMVSWIGFQQAALPYTRAERAAGTTKYPLRKMLGFALDGILSFSSKPLKMATGLGAFCALLAVAGILYALGMRIFTSTWVEGWTALMIAILFMGGVQLLCLGVIGEYLARVYSEAKARPLYVVQERLGYGRRALPVTTLCVKDAALPLRLSAEGMRG